MNIDNCILSLLKIIGGVLLALAIIMLILMLGRLFLEGIILALTTKF